MRRNTWTIGLMALLLIVTLSHQAEAYLGPGGAVSAVGSALALLAAVVIALFGFFWFPLKRMMKKRKRSAENQIPTDAVAASKVEPEGAAGEGKAE